MEGQQQLPAEEVQQGRNIVSLRRELLEGLKHLTYLRVLFPNSLSRIANQVVCLCAWLTNFQPTLVPSSQGHDNEVEEEVDEYLMKYYSSEADTSGCSETDSTGGSACESED